MKKIITAALCAALTITSIASVSAASGSDNSSAETSLGNNSYEFLGTAILPNNFATFYINGSNIDQTSGIELINPETSEMTVQYFNFSKGAVSIHLSGASGYTCSQLLRGGKGSCNRKLYFNNTGGTYEKIRVKLSDFSDYFNSDGTYTMDFFGNVHNYNFTDEGNGYYSSLIFVSGSAITAVAPDSNGMAEFYVSTKLGEGTFYMTDYRKRVSGSSSAGGGTSGSTFCGFTIGDVDKNGYLSVKDATLVQKYLASIEYLDELSQRNADADKDGKINVLDATAIQKYLAGII